jgi:hypothetical protein
MPSSWVLGPTSTASGATLPLAPGRIGVHVKGVGGEDRFARACADRRERDNAQREGGARAGHGLSSSDEPPPGFL